MADRPPRATRTGFSLFHSLRVRWAELDPQGIVFNPRYFVYFDVAVTESLRAIGFAYPDGFAPYGSDLFAVHASANFVDSARYDDVIDVGVRVAHLGRTSARFELAVFRGDALLVEGTLVYVNGDRENKAPKPLPEAFVQRAQAFEPVAPTRGAAS
jgi:acyl-CoA thioester hydrolase